MLFLKGKKIYCVLIFLRICFSLIYFFRCMLMAHDETEVKRVEDDKTVAIVFPMAWIFGWM